MKTKSVFFDVLLTGILFCFIISCKQDELIKVPALIIGDTYKGGKVAYILESGDPGFDPNIQHGFIASSFDQSINADIYWNHGCENPVNVTSTAIGTGKANTYAIIKTPDMAIGGSYAAQVCDDLVLEGYTDWYLPSKDELNKLYLSREVIGGFNNIYYWSSSEFDYRYAWIQGFGQGGQMWTTKKQGAGVRAIRSF